MGATLAKGIGTGFGSNQITKHSGLQKNIIKKSNKRNSGGMFGEVVNQVQQNMNGRNQGGYGNKVMNRRRFYNGQ